MAVDSPLTASPWRKSLPKHGSTAANWNKPKSYVELILNGRRENISIPSERDRKSKYANNTYGPPLENHGCCLVEMCRNQ